MRRRTGTFLLRMTLAALALTGCIKTKVSMEIKPDGSGSVTTLIGFPAAMMSMATEAAPELGQDPMQELEQMVKDQLGETVSFRRYTEGEYEWIEAAQSFANLDELAKIMTDGQGVEDFSAEKEETFFRDRYTLDFRMSLQNEQLGLDPATLQGAEELGLGLDPAELFDVQVAARLPGRVAETNGTYNEETGEIVWSGSTSGVIEVHAVSEAWNLGNLAIIAGAAGLVVLILGGGVVFLLVRSSRKRAKQGRKASAAPASPARKASPAPREQPSAAASHAPRPASPPMVPSEARGLLEQVNQHVLKGRGVIHEGSGTLRLEWASTQAESGKREILIQGAAQGRVRINGKDFPATPDGIKLGLVSSLQEMRS